ncbi:4'-phosphopantetheinyl transferase family protein [Lacrimispora sp.]|jgi:4'-phosphopantetheinyl transferase|uniref:4'-phosphopantetheinyl transferase family protein n=1 Tax=Lacrimispora sp. TaxID=2719234 RepID=UPI0028A893AE|nr:4'-phosphopantetheinyl transferase superfamily protein [Lacrimispora sp.]
MIEIYLSKMEVPEGMKKYEWEHELGKKLLFSGLKETYGLTEKELDSLSFAAGVHGKPYLKDFPHIHYNVSHTDGMVICGFSDEEIGVDVERIRPFHDGILRKVMSDAERDFLESLEIKERPEYFFRIWTLKESYGKAVGCGIAMSLSAVSFTLRDKENPICSIPDFSFFQQSVDEEYILSVCRAGNEEIKEIKVKQKLVF